MPELVRDGVALAYEEAGAGEPSVVLVHGMACHGGFLAPQATHLARTHRVLAPDLRGHGRSDAPGQRYTMETFADDLAWTCARLGFERPLVVGHSLGGLVALQFAVACPDSVAGVVLIDSVLLAQGDRAGFVRELVAGLRGPDAEQALRAYFGTFFAPRDDPARKRWILDEAARTAPHVIASAWEETTFGWDDAEALRACRAPLLYLDAGTPNADLPRAAALHADLALGRTVGSGHFSPLEVPEQVNAMLDRFLAVGLPVPPR